MSKRQEWRFQTRCVSLKQDDLRESFNEVVVGDWLHAEALDTDNRSAYVDIAGLTFWVHIRNKGPVITMCEDRRSEWQKNNTDPSALDGLRAAIAAAK